LYLNLKQRKKKIFLVIINVLFIDNTTEFVKNSPSTEHFNDVNEGLRPRCKETSFIAWTY